MNINKFITDEYVPSRLFLCNSKKEIIQQITPASLQGRFKFNSIGEITFTVHRYYYDALTGQQTLVPYYDRLEAFYIVYLEGFGYYQLQDCPIISEGIDEYKDCTAYSLEYNLSQKYLELFSVNAGTVISIESEDIVYEIATEYDPNMLYYKMEDGVYIAVEIQDEYEFADGTFYINNTRVRLYYPSKPHLSLLHLILEKAPDWQIGHVSRSLMFQERTFQIDRESIYDFIMNTLCSSFKCIAVFDTVNNTINLYPEDETDETGAFDTDIYVSFDNFAKEMKVEYSADDIKTVLRVVGSDDLDIRSVNLGSAQITDLSWFHTRERMGDHLFEKYSEYLLYCEEQNERYKQLWQEYESLYNQKLILENKIPVQDFVVQIDDIFEKLYCIYAPIESDDMSDEEFLASFDASMTALSNKLKLYHLDETTNKRMDSILLSLSKGDLSAVFRLICNSSGEYSIQLTITDANNATVQVADYSLEEWILGEISVSNKASVLTGYQVRYIGTLGAFFCLTKDETKPETLDEYGLNLLKSEEQKYAKVQSVQVAGGLAETKNSFDADDFNNMMALTPPSSPRTGVLWLDRSSTPSQIKAYQNGSWIVPESADDITYRPTDYENFIRYLDNLVKLTCVRDEIAEREQEISEIDIQLYLNESRRIDITQSCELRAYFTEDEYCVLSYFLREDEYSDDSFVTTEYMSQQEIQQIKKELLEAGTTELNKRAKPQLKFSATLANVLAIPGFEPLLGQFELGNFIHIELRKDFLKIVRLLEVEIDFFNPDDFSCTFGDMLQSKDQADIHADLLAQAATMAKSVATNQSKWQKAVAQANDIDTRISEGLIDANTSLYSDAVDQAISLDTTGIHLRKYTDETKTSYEDIQGWITNSGLFYSDDGFKSQKSLYGKFTINGVEHFGILSDAVIGGYVSGAIIEGGEINIGDGNFVVDADGTVSMKNATIENYIKSSEFAEVTGKMMYRIELRSQGPTIFTDTAQTTTLTCRVYSWDDDITEDLDAQAFTWKYNSGSSQTDEIFASGVKQITVNNASLHGNSRFYCEVEV